MNGKNIGDIGEITVLAEFVKRGIPVFIPYGENSKVDLIAIFDNKPQKIQVKTTGTIEDNGSYIINLKNCSMRSNGQSVISLCSENDVDYFALYCLGRPEPLLFSFDELKDKPSITIRFDGRKFSNSIYEEEYLFSKILNEEKIEGRQKIKDNFCVDCGIPISKFGTRCNSCAVKQRKAGGCPYSKDELKAKIRTQSFSSIGRESNVSDNAIRKWCKKMNLPSKKSDINKYSDEEWAQI